MLYQNLFFRAGAGRSRAFIGGAGAEEKISRAGAEEKWLGSATLVKANKIFKIFLLINEPTPGYDLVGLEGQLCLVLPHACVQGPHLQHHKKLSVIKNSNT